MSDDLALAVGKIILAWGNLDQQLHLLIRSLEHALGDSHSAEGRFTERRKIFRRLCMRLANGDDTYKRNFDKACAQLVRLERKRGKIAHGIAAKSDDGDGALFFSFPEAFATLHDKPEDDLLESLFSFRDLEMLVSDIQTATDKNTTLALEALRLWRQENPPTPQQLHSDQTPVLRSPSRQSTPSDKGREQS